MAVGGTDPIFAAGPVTSQLSDQDFRLYRDLIYRLAGISLSEAKKPMVAGRLARRLRQLDCAGYREYYARVQKDLQETQILIDLLTTNETYFFREPKHFDYLGQHIARQGAAGGPLRLWCAASSSGEEPYTIAMVLAETMGGRRWELIASDLSARVLDKARSGHYSDDEVEDIPRGLLRKYFLRGVGSYAGTVLVKPELRNRVDFRQINLINPLPDLGQLDAIFLRNVMIYFDLETKRRLIARLEPMLRPGGHLFVSHSENLNGVSDAFKVVQPSIYRKPHA